MFVRGCKLVVALAICLTIGGLIMGSLATPAPAAALAEKHPRIRTALDELRAAKEELEKADTNFGGHKKEAIEAVKAAIDQLKICIDND